MATKRLRQITDSLSARRHFVVGKFNDNIYFVTLFNLNYNCLTVKCNPKESHINMLKIKLIPNDNSDKYITQLIRIQTCTDLKYT